MLSPYFEAPKHCLCTIRNVKQNSIALKWNHVNPFKLKAFDGLTKPTKHAEKTSVTRNEGSKQHKVLTKYGKNWRQGNKSAQIRQTTILMSKWMWKKNDGISNEWMKSSLLPSEVKSNAAGPKQIQPRAFVLISFYFFEPCIMRRTLEARNTDRKKSRLTEKKWKWRNMFSLHARN